MSALIILKFGIVPVLETTRTEWDNQCVVVQEATDTEVTWKWGSQ